MLQYKDSMHLTGFAHPCGNPQGGALQEFLNQCTNVR
jgi:hypothetical protein